MLKYVVAIATLVSIFLLAGCGGSSSSASSRLRVVHASPDAPNVDVLVRNRVVLSNVAFRDASGYLSTASGDTPVAVRVTGTTTTVISATTHLQEKVDYTLIAANRVANIEPLLLTDDNRSPSAGNIKLRVVHGAPSAPNVDVYVTAPGEDIANLVPTLSDVPFKAASGYLEVPAGTYRVRVTVAGTKDVAIDTGAVTLVAGQIRTAIAVDAVGGGAPFSALLLADKN